MRHAVSPLLGTTVRIVHPGANVQNPFFATQPASVSIGYCSLQNGANHSNHAAFSWNSPVFYDEQNGKAFGNEQHPDA